jgi:uncharacterized protein YqgC (DUF456 family)
VELQTLPDLVNHFAGDLLGLFVGDLVGLFVGALLGIFVGDLVGLFVGDFVGLFEGDLRYDVVHTNLSATSQYATSSKLRAPLVGTSLVATTA